MGAWLLWVRHRCPHALPTFTAAFLVFIMAHPKGPDLGVHPSSVTANQVTESVIQSFLLKNRIRMPGMLGYCKDKSYVSSS